MRKTYRQFDEFFKFIMTLNTAALLPVLNYLYNTDFKMNDVTIVIENNEQINVNQQIGRFNKNFADLMIAITEHYDGAKQRHIFHIELQSRLDKMMPYRMLQYGLQYGLRAACFCNNKMMLKLPRQKVLYPLKIAKDHSVDKLLIKQHGKDDFIFDFESVYVDDITDAEIKEKHLGLFALFKLFNRSLEVSDPNKNKALLENAFETIDDNYTNYIKLTEVEVESMKQAMQVVIKGDMDLGAFKNIRKEAERVVAERHRAAAEGRAEGRAEGKAEGKAEGLIEGETRKSVQIVKNMLLDGTLSDDQIMRFADIDRTELDRIKAML